MQINISQVFVKSSLVAFLAISGAYIALAQTDATSTVEAESEMEATTTVTETVAPQSRALERKTLSLQMQNRVLNLAANVSNRGDALVLRFENIMKRMESRAAKLEAQGSDMAEVRIKINEANAALIQAKSELGTIDAKIANVVRGENSRDSWETARGTFMAIKTNILEARRSLKEALEAMKRSASTPAPAVIEVSTTTDQQN